MPTDLIRYDLLVQDALKGVVRRVLANAMRDGIPGEHHFYLSFRTREKGVRISQSLRDKYPDEMTIVLQHQFWDLSVNEHVIEVGLSFSGVPEKLVIPFDAVSGFFDPSVQFGLKFEPSKDGAATGAAKASPAGPKGETGELAKLPRGSSVEPQKPGRKASEKPAKAAPADPKLKIASEPAPGKPKDEATKDEPKVISLDAFRKKP
jgi:hypothetical protein